MKKIVSIVLILALAFSSFATFAIEGNLKPEKESELENFEEKIYVIRNPKTQAQFIFKGDGKIILKSLDPDFEFLDLVRDAKTGEANYCTKTFIGEKIVEKVYKADKEAGTEEYTDRMPSYRTIVYDKDGNEIGLSVGETYSVNFAINNYISYYENDGDNFEKRKLIIFNNDTKEKKEAEYENIYFFADKIIISTDPYDSNKQKEMIIMDEEFNEEKRIKNCNFAGVANIADMQFGRVTYKENNDQRYNYLDQNFKFIFDKPIDTFLYDEKEPIQKIQSNGKEYDFDFTTLERVSEIRDIKKEREEDKSYINYDEIRKKYEATQSEIKKKDASYDYVNTLEHNGKAIHYVSYMVDKEEGKVEYYYDVYDNDGNKILNSVKIDYTNDKNGLFLVNNDTVYDTDFNIIKLFDKKVNIQQYTVFGKTYLTDSVDENYHTYDSFNVYDEDFNIVREHIYSFNPYTIDDLLIIDSDEGTQFYNKNLVKVIELKDKHRTIDYRNEDRRVVFTDRITNRKGIMDSDFNDIISNLKDVTDVKKEYFTFQNGFKYGLMDYDANVLISFSIFDTFNEDTNQYYNNREGLR